MELNEDRLKNDLATAAVHPRLLQSSSSLIASISISIDEKVSNIKVYRLCRIQVCLRSYKLTGPTTTTSNSS